MKFLIQFKCVASNLTRISISLILKSDLVLNYLVMCVCTLDLFFF